MDKSVHIPNNTEIFRSFIFDFLVFTFLLFSYLSVFRVYRVLSYLIIFVSSLCLIRFFIRLIFVYSGFNFKRSFLTLFIKCSIFLHNMLYFILGKYESNSIEYLKSLNIDSYRSSAFFENNIKEVREVCIILGLMIHVENMYKRDGEGYLKVVSSDIKYVWHDSFNGFSKQYLSTFDEEREYGRYLCRNSRVCVSGNPYAIKLLFKFYKSYIDALYINT